MGSNKTLKWRCRKVTNTNVGLSLETDKHTLIHQHADVLSWSSGIFREGIIVCILGLLTHERVLSSLSSSAFIGSFWQSQVAVTQSPFLLHEEPTESLALPPLVVQRICAQCWHWTEVWECEKIVLMFSHWEQRTSRKKELGACTSFLSLCMCSSAMGSAFKRSISILTSGFGKYLIINTPLPLSLIYLLQTLSLT